MPIERYNNDALVMNDRSQKYSQCSWLTVVILLGALIVFVPGVAPGQLSDLRLPISLDADSTDYDGKNSMLRFKGLRLSQGNIGIAADEGLASKLDFEDSVWRFSGNVVIDVENGHIECETADLKFSNHQLLLAEIQGNPATFELTRSGSDDATYAEAGELRYDLVAGTIEFSDEAKITEGGNQISSSFLVYNIKEQRINAQSSRNGDEKVKIIYTPRDADPAENTEDDGEEPATDTTEESVDREDGS